MQGNRSSNERMILKIVINNTIIIIKTLKKYLKNILLIKSKRKNNNNDGIKNHHNRLMRRLEDCNERSAGDCNMRSNDLTPFYDLSLLRGGGLSHVCLCGSRVLVYVTCNCVSHVWLSMSCVIV